MREYSTIVAELEGSWSAVGQKPAISSWTTRPSRKPPIDASTSLKCECSSSSTRCQLMSRSGPSMNPSRDTDIMRTIFLIYGSTPCSAPLRVGEYRVETNVSPYVGASKAAPVTVRVVQP